MRAYANELNGVRWHDPLRKRMTEELQLRNLSPITAAVYVKAVERFAKHFHRAPDRLGAEEVRQWLLYLTNDRKVSAASLQVHRAALRFLYVTTLKQPWFRRGDPVAQTHPLAPRTASGRLGTPARQECV